ncbi:alkaline phosphatase family protein [Niallia sp. Krafla_26]|uniref:alkaline phosphatase family protein n=1 Tax=Niallia sp. Krafla_26 TaxID=3064703 RepID=UPI003D177AE9
MKLFRKNMFLCLVLVLLLTPVSTPLAKSDNLSAKKNSEHVILIDWDGFDPEFLDRADTPNLDSLIKQGTHTTALSTYKSISNSARASMVTGAYPEVHGNTSAYYDLEQDKAIGQNRFLAAETLAESLASEGKTVASVQWYMVQNYGTSYGNPEQLYVQPGGSFEKRVDAAIDILNQRPVNSGGQMVTVPKIPDFLAVYGSDLDGLVHEEGPDSPSIGGLMAELDRQVGRLIQATKDVGIYHKTTFIVTGDHGMTTWNPSLAQFLLNELTEAGFKPEILTTGKSAAEETDVIIVQNVRLADITLRGNAATPEGYERVKQAFEQVPHIARILEKEDLKALHASDKVGDFVLEAEAPWSFSLLNDGKDRGSHGSLEEMEVPLILSGNKIRHHALVNDAKLIDIAPTISKILGTRSPKDAQGRVLSEALTLPAHK